MVASRISAAAALLAALAAAPRPANAQTRLPTGFTASEVCRGLASPTAMAFAPDGRLFFCEKGGRIRVIKGGALLAKPFVTLKNVLLRGSVDASEAGTLGIAVHPAFADTPYVYVYYTATAPIEGNRIVRFRAAGDTADAGEGEVPILVYESTGGWNHNGGAIHFGPDGKLYAAHGDAYRDGASQSLTTLLGKIIRMHPVPDSQAQVPADNPFYGTATGRNRLIWALGLRNPFTFAFQPGTGRMLINDVGWNTYEEVNEGKPGRNFGWSATEGPFDAGAHADFTAPLLYFGRSGASGQAAGDCIVGGTFYNPAQATFPQSYVGKYFFGDFPFNSWIRFLDPDQPGASQPFVENTNHADMAVGPDGALWYTDHEGGRVMKIQYGGASVVPRRGGGGAGARLTLDFENGLRIFWPSRGAYSDLRGKFATEAGAPR